MKGKIYKGLVILIACSVYFVVAIWRPYFIDLVFCLLGDIFGCLIGSILLLQIIEKSRKNGK